MADEVVQAALADAEGADYLLLCAVPTGTDATHGTPAGFAAYGPTPCTEGTWDLYWIAVDPADARRGTGSELLAAVEAACVRRGARMLVVETASKESYSDTRAFYERRAYRAESRIADYYATGDDLIVYVKRF